MAQTIAVAPANAVTIQRRVDWLTPLLVLIFVLSGASGLIYQIAWIKLLSLTFGVTIYAVSTVVAAFMGGLALGSFLGGRLSDRVGSPVLAYAAVELLIAGLGLKSVDALDWAQSVYLNLYPRDADQAALQIVALRFVLSAAVVLLPTTLMGATLPLIVRGSLSFGQQIGARISSLYASNTTGAIIGTLVAGFILIGSIGVRSTIVTAAALNAVAAAFALMLGLLAWLQRGARSGSSPQPSAVSQNGEVTMLVSSRVRAAVLVIFAVQGFASLAYEVIWTRVFAVLLDGSTYAFSIVLAVVLFGIAAGSAAISPILGRPFNWVRIYAGIQIGVAAFSLAGIFTLTHIYGVMSYLARIPFIGAQLDPTGFTWTAVAAAVVILPVMLLLGASFPIAAQIVIGSRESTGRDLGLLYGGNTAGAILGAWGAGFFLLPALGSQLAIKILAGINGILAIVLATAGGGRKLPAVLTAGVALLFAALISGAIPNMYQRMLAGRFPGSEMVWIGEGMESTITIVRRLDSGYLDMHFNGQSQASDNPDVLWFHRLLGHLPMAIDKDPQDVLIVGVGGMGGHGECPGRPCPPSTRHRRTVRDRDGGRQFLRGRKWQHDRLSLRPPEDR